MRSQPYYFEDILFQLELNLQTIRRDLIRLLEEYQFQDCFDCNRLKCCCSDTKSSLRSTTLSIATDDTSSNCELHELSMDAYYNAAPPPESLPTPEWTENATGDVQEVPEDEKVTILMINAWIRASIPNVIQPNSGLYFPVPNKVLDQVNYSWPPFPMSIWSDERLKETTERENMLTNERERNGNDSVEAFFKYFSGKSAVSKSTFA